MNYLITGGAGFIGRHLVRRILEDPSARIGVIDDCSRTGLPESADFPDSVRFYRNDICDAAALGEAMQGVEVVFHLAAVSSVRVAEEDVPRAFHSNIMGTAAVVDTARACGVKRLVLASSREVYGEPEHLPVPESAALRPNNTYGLTKAAAELICRGVSGLEVAIVRLANVVGPGDCGRVVPIFLRQALAGKPITIYGGDQVLDLVWIGDVVDVMTAVSDLSVEPGGPLNIGSGVGLRISELAARVVAMKSSPR